MALSVTHNFTSAVTDDPAAAAAGWVVPGNWNAAHTISGSISVANGGTGTTTAFTAGSVVFAGASGVYSQDNTNFFWDDALNILKIAGTLAFQASTAQFTINGTGLLDYGSTAAGQWTFKAPMAVDAGTVTVSTPAFNMLQTWNNGAVNFIGAVFNYVDTSSGGNSYIAQWQLSSINAFTIRKDSYVQTVAFADFGETVAMGNGFGGAVKGVNVGTAAYFGFAAGAAWYGGVDVAFQRNAAGIVEVNSGTSGTFRDIKARFAITNPSTVAGLPAAGTAGRRSFVTDATVTTFASIVAGTGANGVPVYDDGTNWRIG